MLMKFFDLKIKIIVFLIIIIIAQFIQIKILKEEKEELFVKNSVAIIEEQKKSYETYEKLEKDRQKKLADNHTRANDAIKRLRKSAAGNNKKSNSPDVNRETGTDINERNERFIRIAERGDAAIIDLNACISQYNSLFDKVKE